MTDLFSLRCRDEQFMIILWWSFLLFFEGIPNFILGLKKCSMLHKLCTDLHLKGKLTT